MYPIDYQDTKPVTLYVEPGLLLFADPAYEAMRADRVKKVLKPYGSIFKKGQPASWKPKYNPNVRCYDNAWSAAVNHPKLILCEGLLQFTLPDGYLFELPHGWCCTSDGEVVDPTSYKTQYNSCTEYWGVPIQFGYAERWYEKYHFHGVLEGLPNDANVGPQVDPPHLWLEGKLCKN